MIVTGQNVEKFPEETWVKVTGILDKTTYKRMPFPLVKISKLRKLISQQTHMYMMLYCNKKNEFFIFS